MLGILVYLPIILIFIVLTIISHKKNEVVLIRDKIIVSVIIWSAGIIVVSEFLSLYYSINFPVLALFWITVNLLLTVYIFSQKNWLGIKSKKFLSKPNWIIILLISIVCIVVLLSGLMAFFSPPNNPDSLSYHMTRQLFWIQQGSLDHYYTANDRQIMMPPLVEIIGMHLMLLSCNDFWANTLQWIAYILVAITVSNIAKSLGANNLGQTLSAFFAVSVPLTFHQASNPKNDLMLGFFCCSLIWYGLRMSQSKKILKSDWIFIGINLGLVWVTKGTGLIFSIPIMVYIGIIFIKQLQKEFWKPILVITTIACLLVFGHYYRNYSWYGSPFGALQDKGYDLKNESFSPKAIASNIIRNTFLHLGSPSQSINDNLYKFVQLLHSGMKQDINEPKTTFWGEEFEIFYYPKVETNASAPIHVLLIILAPIVALLNRKKLDHRWWVYYLILLSCYFLFCLILKWQPWHARLHVPIFCLMAPALGVVYTIGNFKRTVTLLLTGITCVAFFPALNSQSRPVFGNLSIFSKPRVVTQFYRSQHLIKPQEAAYEIIEKIKPKCIRFYFAWDKPYPLQSWIYNKIKPRPHFWGQVLPKISPDPDAIFLRTDGLAGMFINYPGIEEKFQVVGDTTPYSLYIKESLIKQHKLSKHIPRFVGWNRETGILRTEYINKKTHYNTYRRTNGERCQLIFNTSNIKKKIIAEFYTNNSANEFVVVKINERVLDNIDVKISNKLIKISINFDAINGKNILSFNMPKSDENSTPIICYFNRLQIIDSID